MIVPIAIIIVALQIWVPTSSSRIFKWLTLTLFAYIGAAILAHPPWREVLKATFIPHLSFSGKYLLTLVAILGTTISPYLFFWQSSQEVEKRSRWDVRRKKNARRNYAELHRAVWDTNIGMFSVTSFSIS